MGKGIERWETLFLAQETQEDVFREVPVDLQDLCEIEEFRYAAIGKCRGQETAEAAAGAGIKKRGYC